MCAFLLLGHTVPMVSPWQSQDVRKERFRGKGPVTMTPRMMTETTTGLILMIWQEMLVKVAWNKSSAWRSRLKPHSTTSHGPKDNTASTRKEIALKVGWLLLFGSLVDPISINDIVVGLSYRFKPTHTMYFSNAICPFCNCPLNLVSVEGVEQISSAVFFQAYLHWGSKYGNVQETFATFLSTIVGTAKWK